MSWKWLASVRLYLPSLPRKYDPWPGYARKLAWASLRRGVAFLHEGNYDRALEACDEAIQSQPDLPEAFNTRSCVFLDKAEYDRTIDDCNRAIAMKPDYAWAFCNRGSAYLGKGDSERALQDYDQALRLKPDLAIALNNRGSLFLLRRNPDRALQDYDRAVQLQPDLAMSFRNRGIAAFVDRRFSQAKQDCAEAVRQDPKDGHNLIWLYLATARDGQPDKAQFEGQAATLDLAKWPGQEIEFLRGSSTREALLAASHDENSYKEREQRCSAYFLIGQCELLRGDLLQAASSFRKATEFVATNCLEYLAAEAELHDLNADNKIWGIES